MKSLEDKRLCPHCLRELHERPYLMARQATENVLSLKQIAWVLVIVLALVLVGS